MPPVLLTQCKPVLQLLRSTSFTYLKKPVIEKAKINVFHCITEICYNLLRSTLALDDIQQVWIQKNLPVITILSSKKVPVSIKRKYLLRAKFDFLPKLLNLIQGEHA